MHEKNPATSLYQLWRSLLERTDASASQYLSRTHGIKTMRIDNMGEPVIGFGRIAGSGYYSLCADFTLRANGAFSINHYDHDLKHACYQTFLGWGWVVRSRVVFFHELHSPLGALQSFNYEEPIPYFRWDSLRRGTLLHLVPDEGSWRIEVHPDSPSGREARRALALEYDEAANRYLRYQRAAEGPSAPTATDVMQRNRDQIKAISLLLDPYSTARPGRLTKEAHYDSVDA